jgi:hypothetical protein
MSKPDIILKPGDTEPAVEIQVIDEEGDPVDLTGAAARFKMKHINDTENTIDSSAIIRDPPEEGMLAYTWKKGDDTRTGIYHAEFGIDYNGAMADTFDVDETIPANEKRTYIEIEVVEALP